GPEHYDRSTYADSTYTRNLLGAAGINCPTIGDLVTRYLEHCADVGYIPPPNRPAPARRPALAEEGR
ncbi:hypothetical protein FrEUN1fDRAFT_7341, partial [Parafrankia sp. EUN1f]